MAGGRRLTAAQARDRRSKRLAIGLGALLLVVGVIQGPKLLKQLSPPAPPSPPAAAAPTGAAGATSAAGSAASAGTVTTGTQLQSFSLLAVKDPFYSPIQQTGATAPAGTAAKPAAGARPAAKSAKP